MRGSEMATLFRIRPFKGQGYGRGPSSTREAMPDKQVAP